MKKLKRKSCVGTATFTPTSDLKLQVVLLSVDTCIETLKYTYPLKLMVPEYASHSKCKWLYPVTFGEGLVEGDDIQLQVTVKSGASVAIVTQSSTKVFQCVDGEITKQTLNVDVGERAFLASLPDPIVCFKDAIYAQKQVIHICESSNIILLDWYTAGRTALNEIWDFKRYESRTQINLNNEIVYMDSLIFQDLDNLSLKTAMKHFEVQGTIILLGKELQSHSTDLVKIHGAQKSIGSTYSCDNMVGVSPLKLRTADESASISGCQIKFATKSTSEAYEVIKSVIEPLEYLIGGDPFENKY